MPNYKIFQDNADSLLTKVYGVDSSGVSQALLTSASGRLDVIGSVAVSGPVEISGTVGVSGSVAVSGPVEISGTVGVSGNVAVSGPVEVSGNVTVSGHTILDSGPTAITINSGGDGESGEVIGSYDVLSYSSWTLAVKYSGSSGDLVSVALQVSALSGGAATDADYVTDSIKTFVSGSWNLFTSGITPRYARLYYVDTGESGGSLVTYFQAQN